MDWLEWVEESREVGSSKPAGMEEGGKGWWGWGAGVGVLGRGGEESTGESRGRFRGDDERPVGVGFRGVVVGG